MTNNRQPKSKSGNRLLMPITIATTLLGSVAALKNPGAAADTVSENFVATRVVLAEIDAEVKIRNWQRDDVRLSVTTEGATADAFVTDLADDVLTVRQRRSTSQVQSITVIARGQGAKSEVNIGNESITVNGNSVSYSQKNAKPLARLELRLPANMRLDLEAFAGEALIDRLDGTLSAQGNGEIRIHAADNARLRLYGNASAVIDDAAGDLALELNDNAEIDVSAGSIDQLDVTATDNAGGSIRADATHGSLQAADNADIEVAKMTRRPTMRATDNADIVVGNWRR